MAIEANRQNSQLACEKHNALETKPCWPSARHMSQPQFTGHVCGSRWRKCKNLP